MSFCESEIGGGASLTIGLLDLLHNLGGLRKREIFCQISRPRFLTYPAGRQNLGHENWRKRSVLSNRRGYARGLLMRARNFRQIPLFLSVTGEN
jgi:hypothetical protein